MTGTPATLRGAVFADSHGNREKIREAVRFLMPLDLLVHLGDGIGDGERVAREEGIPFICVQGNEDRTGEACEDRYLYRAGDWTFLFIHGHQFEINPWQSQDEWDHSTHRMAEMGDRLRADALFFGHTHSPWMGIVKGVVLLNPGDLYAGSMSHPTCVIFTVEGDFASINLMQGKGGSWERIKSMRLQKGKFY